MARVHVCPSWCTHQKIYPSFHICVENPSKAVVVDGVQKFPVHNKGKFMSAEQKNKIRESQRARWARVKAEKAAS